eukprot:CAMPEP_0206323892 /NCGR_PEP_ID=MMETSP0106_2-20121207/20222_1 /ASSEMBLY_ACC=CAM_ASM_000206 /TAXON_ID=81532 /ORGANISM="Acanthoeca-like sp., Strain 10tr" /LENGTH=32 /DNA_ID= /DNA_START= /DNA_END= /DNA_ORIENTATION=
MTQLPLSGTRYLDNAEQLVVLPTWIENVSKQP